ncbi:MAG: hypothetical protein KC468_25500 [Myxococcales bacterium]|nr:hypothetical protein [Myxococcales bacterium]
MRALPFAPLVMFALTLAATGCTSAESSDKAKLEKLTEAAGGEAPVKAKDFDLMGMAALIKDGDVGSAEGLERAINSSDINRVDLDKDGKTDAIVLDESRDDGTIVFELRAVPSGSGERDDAVAIAKLGFTIEGDQAIGEAIFVEAVDGGHDVHATFEYTVKIEGGSLYANHMFIAWVLAPNRPLYHGEVDVDVRVEFNGGHVRLPKKFKKPKKFKFK